MEEYPEDYVEHNLPLLLLSGIGDATERNTRTDGRLPHQENGTKVFEESPACARDKAKLLLEEFMKNDATNLAWTTGAPLDSSKPLRFKIRTVGRTYSLPPRKAAPPPQPASMSPPQSPQGSVPRSPELHSTLSPLSPSSPIFPDGVLTPLWFAKHQHHAPSAFLSVFELSTDTARATAQDNQVKADLNAVKNALSRSGYKARFAAILISDKSILEAPDLEERLAGIRRATGLDPKNGLFFLPPTSSRPEIAAFVHGVLTVLQPACIEYYRELTKHARRKKARSSVPLLTAPPSRGGSQALSQQGWNTRYEVKQGVFAEFRQEMDVAERHYSQAIDDMINSEGVFETVPSWSPRWNEHRLLSDALALRVVRCQLWLGATTGAVQSWVNYLDRMKDLIDRRGKGSLNYGWEAWEARWSRIMAQLVQRAELAPLQMSAKQASNDSVELPGQQIYCQPEKAFSAADRLPPFHFLHHAGYWYRLSAKYARERWKKAIVIPEEDRLPPGQSPASQLAGRVHNYDNYLVPDPYEEHPLSGNHGFDHIADISRSLNLAAAEFGMRRQHRTCDQTTLDLAKDLIDAGCHEDAMKILQRLWQETAWRRSQWFTMGMELLLLLQICAQKLHDYEALLATSWELMCDTFPLPADRKVDLAYCYDFRPHEGHGKCSATLENLNILSPVSVSFAFGSSLAHAGEQLECQLVLTSRARRDTAPIQLSAVEVYFDDGRMLRIMHRNDDSEEHTSQHNLKIIEDVDESYPDQRLLRADADLLLSPGETRIFDFCLTHRETGLWHASRACLEVHADAFLLQYRFGDAASIRQRSWWYPTTEGLRPRLIMNDQSTQVTILPKPPKMKINVRDVREQYYTGESITLVFELVNEEAEDADAVFDLCVLGQSEAGLAFHWTGDQADGGKEDANTTSRQTNSWKIASAGTIVRTATLTAPSMPADFVVSLDLRYHLSSDPDAPLSKTQNLNLSFVSPFEANYNFTPRQHSADWPSFFEAEGHESTEELTLSFESAHGIPQMWQLDAHITSFATEELTIHGCETTVTSLVSDLICESSFNGTSAGALIEPQQSYQAPFNLTTRKISLDDRRPSAIELSLVISWSRRSRPSEEPAIVTTTLPVPRLTIPTSEPRVLCTLHQPKSPADLISLQYHIENPSMHFLTFALTMEATEDFAFSGLKYRTLNITPLSRLSIEYKLLPYGAAKGQADLEAGSGRWVWPVLRVVDSYYQKTLPVQAAGPGVKNDDDGNVGVWLPI